MNFKDIKEITDSDIARAKRKDEGIKSEEYEETEAFDMDGLNSSLMGMLPGHPDSLRRYNLF